MDNNATSERLMLLKQLIDSNNEKPQTLSAEISWSHNIAILEKTKSASRATRSTFYCRADCEIDWRHRVVIF